jgi:hypothetical protein
MMQKKTVAKMMFTLFLGLSLLCVNIGIAGGDKEEKGATAPSEEKVVSVFGAFRDEEAYRFEESRRRYTLITGCFFSTGRKLQYIGI